VGKDATGHIVSEQHPNRFHPIFIIQLTQVGGFPSAKKLYPLKGKIFVEAHNSANRPVQVRSTNLPPQPLPSANTPQVKGIVFFQVDVNEVKNGKNSIRHVDSIAEKRLTC
jgi:hypothetical protein